MFWIVWCYLGLAILQTSDSQRRALVDYSFANNSTPSLLSNRTEEGSTSDDIESSPNYIPKYSSSSVHRGSSRGESPLRLDRRQGVPEQDGVAKGDFAERGVLKANSTHKAQVHPDVLESPSTHSEERHEEIGKKAVILSRGEEVPGTPNKRSQPLDAKDNRDDLPQDAALKRASPEVKDDHHHMDLHIPHEKKSLAEVPENQSDEYAGRGGIRSKPSESDPEYKDPDFQQSYPRTASSSRDRSRHDEDDRGYHRRDRGRVTEDTLSKGDARVFPDDDTKLTDARDSTLKDEHPVNPRPRGDDARSINREHDDRYRGDDPRYRSRPDNVRYVSRNERYPPLDDDRYRTRKDRHRSHDDRYRTRDEDRYRTRDEDRYRTRDEDRYRTRDEDRYRTPDEDRYRARDEDRYRTRGEDRYRTPDDDRHRTPAEERYRTRDEDRYRTRDEDRHRTPDEDRYRARDEDRHRTPVEDIYRTRDEDRYRTPDKDRHRTLDEDRYKTANEDRYRTRDEDRHRTPDEDRYRTRDEDRYRTPDEDRYRTRDEDRHRTSDEDRYRARDEDRYRTRDQDRYRTRNDDAYTADDEDEYRTREDSKYKERTVDNPRRNYNESRKRGDGDKLSSPGDEGRYRPQENDRHEDKTVNDKHSPRINDETRKREDNDRLNSQRNDEGHHHKRGDDDEGSLARSTRVNGDSFVSRSQDGTHTNESTKIVEGRQGGDMSHYEDRRRIPEHDYDEARKRIYGSRVLSPSSAVLDGSSRKIVDDRTDDVVLKHRSYAAEEDDEYARGRPRDDRNLRPVDDQRKEYPNENGEHQHRRGDEEGDREPSRDHDHRSDDSDKSQTPLRKYGSFAGEESETRTRDSNGKKDPSTHHSVEDSSGESSRTGNRDSNYRTGVIFSGHSHGDSSVDSIQTRSRGSNDRKDAISTGHHSHDDSSSDGSQTRSRDSNDRKDAISGGHYSHDDSPGEDRTTRLRNPIDRKSQQEESHIDSGTRRSGSSDRKSNHDDLAQITHVHEERSSISSIGRDHAPAVDDRSYAGSNARHTGGSAGESPGKSSARRDHFVEPSMTHVDSVESKDSSIRRSHPHSPNSDGGFRSANAGSLSAKDVIEAAQRRSDIPDENSRKVSYPVFDPRLSNLTSTDLIRPSERRGTTITSRKRRQAL